MTRANHRIWTPPVKRQVSRSSAKHEEVRCSRIFGLYAWSLWLRPRGTVASPGANRLHDE